jgi:type III pantothenate kinase
VWCGRESNPRHKDFQSFALPTELPHLLGTAKIEKKSNCTKTGLKNRESLFLTVQDAHIVIDLGNTRLKWAVFSDNKLVFAESISREEIREKLDSLQHNYLITKGILSSVAEIKLPEELRSLPLLAFQSGTPVPVINRYESPETLGRDRLANAVYAAMQFPNENVVVIDAGTCLKFDVVNSKGEYLGGSISPGLDMRFRAMHTFTGRLPLIKASATDTIIGTTTESSITSGAYKGMIFEIQGMADYYKQQFGTVKFCFTGGDAPLLAKGLNFPIFADPYLTLRGLYYILQHNA